MKRINQFINQSSIRPQLFITVSIGIITLLTALIFASTWVSDKQVRKLLVKQGKQVTLTLAKNASLALLYDSPENAQTIIKSTLAFPGIMKLAIYRPDHTLFFSSDKKDLLKSHKVALAISPSQPEARIIYEDDNMWMMLAPVSIQSSDDSMEEEIFNSQPPLKDEVIGYVVVASSKYSLKNIDNGILLSNLFMALLIGLILILALQKTIKRLTQPLYNISDVMKKTEQGDFTSQLTAEGPLEVKIIARSYNRMINALTERDEKLKQQNIHLEKQAIHDHLTGLINRIGFERALSLTIEESETLGTEHVLCYMDLDKFKIVNDSCGHSAGDELLKNISDIFRQHIRKDSDVLARIGGDEFALILKNCSLEKARRIGNEICQAIAQYRFHYDNKNFSIGVSIGATPLNKASGNLRDVISRADSACYIAKEKGRGQVHIIDLDDTNIIEHDGVTQIASLISDSIDHNKFQLLYQPFEPLNHTDKLNKHIEILLQMTGPNGKIIPPHKFLSSAERYDLLIDIDRWVIKNTLEHLKHNKNLLDTLDNCSINISGQSVNDEQFAEFIKNQISDHNIEAEKLCFEISESVAINNISQTTQFIQKMHSLGCRIALDNFISGATSFAYINDTNIDFIKIDGEYFKDLTHKPVNQIIVKSINEVAHFLNIKTVAKNIETNETLEELKELGMDYAQGYIISRPVLLAKASSPEEEQDAT